MLWIEPRVDARPDPEVAAHRPRRRFTAHYKLDILHKADACTQPGQVGALLRKEGLYSSHLVTWRQQPAGRADAEEAGTEADRRSAAQAGRARQGGP